MNINSLRKIGTTEVGDKAAKLSEDKSKLSNSSGRFTDLDMDKLRGGYYTPQELAEWMCRWAIRSSDDAVLEPSCGDGSFLIAASKRLSKLDAARTARSQKLRGIEISSIEADKARMRLKKEAGVSSKSIIETSDFFSWWDRPNRPSFDAVVGNPPFIRYQTFPEPHRTLAMEIMRAQGLSPNRLTNIWVPFVVASAAALKVGGRMALVLPAELLQVSYAAQLRSFLTDRFGRINLIACNELFFERAEQEVLLLLAEDARPMSSGNVTCKVNLSESDTVADILGRTPEAVLKSASPKTVNHDSEKWLKYFLDEDEISLMRKLRASEKITNLGKYAAVNVGVVTGKNQFFVLRGSEVKKLRLENFTMPLIGRSAHLQGSKVDKEHWQELADDDQRVHLLHLAPFKGEKPKGSLASYIRYGEENDVHQGYKCSVRTPWYAVPSVYVPDAFVFRQIYDFPRIVINEAEATATDTIHRMRCHGGDPRAVVTNSYTYLTAASAEIEGRSYGGGVLELEPTEAEKLLMPDKLCKSMSVEECDKLIRAGKLDAVLEENSRRILVDQLGLTNDECQMLRRIWEKMRNRRSARSKNGKKKLG